MASQGSRSVRSLLGGALYFACVLPTVGCGRVFEYPDSEPEQGVLLCGDGVDNDFDQDFDCIDRDCDGFCPEESADECRDGRDNDGDGLADGSDPRCWLIAAPRTQPCAESSGAELFETFDGAFIGFSGVEAAWYAWATGSGSTRLEGDRRDGVALFYGTEVGSLVRQRPFSGSWRDFELSFSASVLPRTMLRAAIMPMELAPTTDWPLRGAETQLFAVTLDAERSPATLAIDLEGANYSVLVESTAALCGAALCIESFGRLSVRLTEEGFLASLVYPSGETAEVQAPRPSSLSLPPARLVLQGTGNGERYAEVDDLVLSVKPEQPCGFAVPQIPGKDCEFSGALDVFGQTVSVARDSDGEYCAFVTASAADPSGGPSLPPPETVTVWRSPDGKNWSRASSRSVPLIELPDSATLVGAAIGNDGEGWHGAIAYREDEGMRLAFTDAKRCDDWGELVLGPVLFDDVEAPSYVVAEGRHEIFFTRPSDTARKLWKIGRSEGGTPEELSELPPGAGSPVSVTLAGAEDLVLSYPIVAGPSASGIGLLIGDRTGTSWEPVAPDSILELAPRLDTYEGLGRLTFDDRGAVAAALAWDADGGFLLYAGAATSGRLAASRYTPSVQVGTARLFPAGESLPDDRAVPEQSCGDGTCSGDESCTSCELDCPCGGVELLADPFGPTSPWQMLSDDPEPAAIEYVSTEPPGLNFGAGEPTWSVLPLEQSLAGDFQLSFDLFMPFVGQALTENSTGAWPACSLYVGLGTPPDLGAVEEEAEASTVAGVFAQIKLDPTCEVTDEYYTAPFALSGGVPYPGLDRLSPCSAEATLLTDEWQHVTLRREGSRVTVLTPRQGGCGTTETSVTYAGAVPDLPALLVGFGRGPFEGCPRAPTEVDIGSAPRTNGTIKNLSLRLLDDPEDCPETKALCGEKHEQPSCVDLTTSSEHCGQCEWRCEANEVCREGECRCSDLPGTLKCDGVCIDSSSSPEHCGECGRACAELCVRGTCATGVAGCDEATEIAAEGGTFGLELRPGDSVASVCDTPVFAWAFFTWTPSLVPDADGNPAVVEVDTDGRSLRTVLGIASPSCSNWFACSDHHPHLESGARARFLADGGTTFLIGVGLLDPPHENQTVRLKIGLEQ